MRVQLWGIGTRSKSPAITAQKRINCKVDIRKEADRTSYAVMGRDGLVSFVNLGSSPSRGLWAVNTLPTPLEFTVHAGTLYSINNAGVTAVIGSIGTTTGDVSMADDGKYLVLVDGSAGYWYNMLVPGALTLIIDGNFTTTPKTVTWQDNYFIVTSGATRQFQLSQITPGVDPAVWPAEQINFTGASAGAIQAGISDHSLLNLFSPGASEFWQNAGSPDFPFAKIPGSSQEFGLASAWSLAKFDNALTGLFQSAMGGTNVSRMSGFSLRKISDTDIETLLSGYSSVADARAFAYMSQGHPLYVLSLPTANVTLVYDGQSNIWTEYQDADGDRFWGEKFANFQGRLCVSDRRNGNIYQLSPTTYSDNGSSIPIELVSQHIWNDDKHIGITQLQVDVEGGVGLVSGQGSDPMMDLLVSKDGGNTFTSVGFSSMGPIGEFTTRVIWRSLGAARDWVVKLRITDPVKIILTGASAEIQGGAF